MAPDPDVAKLWHEFIDAEGVDELAAAATNNRVAEFQFDDVRDFDPNLADDILSSPETVLDSLDLAAEEYASPWDAPPTMVVGFPDDRTHDVGVYDPDEVVGELAAIRGQVVKRTKGRLRDVETAFECQLCGNVIRVPQTRGDLQLPHECPGCERQGPFNERDRLSSFVNFQEARVQSLPEHTGSTTTEMIDVELTGDLVGMIEPGDRVVVNAEIGADRLGDTTKRELFADARSVEVISGSVDHVDYEKYIDEIHELAARDDIFELITQSMNPGHHGDSELKLAVALSLFGGVEKVLPTGSKKRGNIHVLVIGDPGTGKSDMLEAVSSLVPRSEFATGKQTSAAGLTATAMKDDFGGDSWTLEAGTLVKAHEGVACIDELDKMRPEDRAGMMQAMSEQRITIDKAASGTLPAKTTVIGAANPKYGSFEPMDSLDEQLDFHTALLNRFDLVFVMRDEVDEDMDREIADHMNKSTRVGQEIADVGPAKVEFDELEYDAPVPEIDPAVFRAYVTYARTLVPKLTDEAAEKAAEDYVELRQENADLDDAPIPVTARSIEGVHRLAEASARVRLSEEITVDDVSRAIGIRDFCLEQLGIDPETGALDGLRLETGEPKSKREEKRFLIQTINRLADESEDDAADADALKEECMIVFDESEYEHWIKKLKSHGDIYEPSTNAYRVSGG